MGCTRPTFYIMTILIKRLSNFAGAEGGTGGTLWSKVLFRFFWGALLSHAVCCVAVMLEPCIQTVLTLTDLELIVVLHKRPIYVWALH